MTVIVSLHERDDFVRGIRYWRLSGGGRRCCPEACVRPIVRPIQRPVCRPHQIEWVTKPRREHGHVLSGGDINDAAGYLIVVRCASRRFNVRQVAAESGFRNAGLENRSRQWRFWKATEVAIWNTGVRIAADSDQEIAFVVERQSVDRVVVIRSRKIGDQRQDR